MDPAVAAKIVASLDAELARRQDNVIVKRRPRWRGELDAVRFFRAWHARFMKRMAKKAAESRPSG
jgi:hypothetical protein